MASACPHGEDEVCSSCNEQWEADLTLTMDQLTVASLQEMFQEAQEAKDHITQRNCTLAITYVLGKPKVSEACIDAAREIATTLMAER